MTAKVRNGRKWGEAKEGGNDIISKILEIIFKNTLLPVKNHSSMGVLLPSPQRGPDRRRDLHPAHRK